jgi:N-acetylglucosamine kinase-like BadF-type ATPase
MALAHAVRAEDGRGPRTALERLVPAYFKLPSPGAVTEAMYLGRIDQRRVVELAPLVFHAAHRRDAVARAILDRVADEVVAFAGAAIKRLDLSRREVEVVLGGGVFQADDGAFLDRISKGIRKMARHAIISRLDAPPVVGAALLGLDAVGATKSTASEVRRALTHARLGASERN